MSCSAQLAMFPTSAWLQRIRPERNEWRWYALSIQPDLFGGAALVRRWGRLGTRGQMRLDLHDNEGAAANALSRMIRHRLRRGYVMMQPDQAITPTGGPAPCAHAEKPDNPGREGSVRKGMSCPAGEGTMGGERKVGYRETRTESSHFRRSCS